VIISPVLPLIVIELPGPMILIGSGFGRPPSFVHVKTPSGEILGIKVTPLIPGIISV
jgi:hypothetical protein